MDTASRSDIRLLAQHSNLAQADVSKLLQQHVHAQPQQWLRFGRWFVLLTGTGFLLAGIIFFFAYNWEALHKFAKMGLIATLLAATAVGAAMSRYQSWPQQALLAAAAMLTGTLFAVYGQIYQTGANAYDLFLVWTLACLPWSQVSGSGLVWALQLLLANITLTLYFDQVLGYPAGRHKMAMMAAGNTAATLLLWMGPARQHLRGGNFLSKLVLTATVVICSIAGAVCIFDKYRTAYVLLLIAVFYGGICYTGLRQRRLLPLALCGISTLFLLAAAITELLDSSGIFLLMGFFMIGGTTALLYQLRLIQKKWNADAAQHPATAD